MTKILVVDDSAVDRRLAGSILEKKVEGPSLGTAGPMTVVYADNGKEALAAIEREAPDLVLTDLQMPEMNGLELVEAVKAKFPAVPIILMTAHGSEEIASQALQWGAASYVPKRNLAEELKETVVDVLAVSGTKKLKQRLLDQCWLKTESHFLLPNDLSHIPAFVGHAQENLQRMKVCDENGLIRVAVCLREALSNAIVHGNLEIDSTLRETNEAQDEAKYIIRDEGPGFDWNQLPDPTDPANLERVSGRGMLLIRTFMDEVLHNKSGNEITLIKRRDSA
jgi:CheY-like chemotaxis protein